MRTIATSLILAMSMFVADPTPARKPTGPPIGDIRLDLADPVVTAIINGQPLRLRVGLADKNVVELNPAAVARIGIPFESGFDADVGRRTLPGISATAQIIIDGRLVLVLLSSHGQDCCAGADGAIGASLLPFATISFVRGSVPSVSGTFSIVMEKDDEHGLQAPVQIGAERLYLQFSFDRPDTIASSSAGAILAKAYGGRFVGPDSETVAAFGVRRPTRTLAFRHSFKLADFPVDRLPTRVADFAGHYEFPSEKPEPGDIVVRRRTTQQAAWPTVLIGRDRMDRCTAITFATRTHELTMHCDFTGATR